MHTQLDLRGPIPTCIFVSEARQHNVLWLDDLIFEAGAFYVIVAKGVGHTIFKKMS